MNGQYTISNDKLEQVIRLYGEMTGDPATDGEIKSTILGDWNEGDEHQDWLNTAPAREIASWLAAMTFTEEH